MILIIIPAHLKEYDRSHSVIHRVVKSTDGGSILGRSFTE